jgi:hypothetical protein
MSNRDKHAITRTMYLVLATGSKSKRNCSTGSIGDIRVIRGQFIRMLFDQTGNADSTLGRMRRVHCTRMLTRSVIQLRLIAMAIVGPPIAWP